MLLGVVAVAFIAWAALPFASELVGATGTGEVESGVTEPKNPLTEQLARSFEQGVSPEVRAQIEANSVTDAKVAADPRDVRIRFLEERVGYLERVLRANAVPYDERFPER